MPLIFKHQHATQRYRMPWGAAIGAVGAIASASMANDKNGGAGASTQSKDPWMQATPWIMNNMQQGQNLQNQLTAQPFSQQQQQAYNNSYAQSDYMRNLVPSLLGQMQNQQVGFDRSNPTAREKAWDWAGLMGSGTPNVSGAGSGSMQQAAAAQAAIDAANRNKTPADAGTFVNQSDILNGTNMSGLSQNAIGGLLGTGKYGAFTYGMNMPTPGTQAYRDMSEYFANGGGDPNNLYGRGTQTANPLAGLMSGGVASPGTSASAASGGANGVM